MESQGISEYSSDGYPSCKILLSAEIGTYVCGASKYPKPVRVPGSKLGRVLRL